MMLTSLSEIVGKCIYCNEEIINPKEQITLKCGHLICQVCSIKNLKNTNGVIKCTFDDCKIEKIEIMEDLNFLEYLDNHKLGDVTCKIHDSSIEYFSKQKRKFLCMKCISQFIMNQTPSKDLVLIDKVAVTKDLFKIRRELENIVKSIDEFLENDKKQDSEFLDNLFANSIDYFNNLLQIKFEHKLELFKNIFKSQIFKSSIKNSKISIPKEIQIENLIQVSKIITKQEDENFVKSLFDKKIQLGLLFRASEHNFSARSFHKLCDNKGSTLILFKSEKDKIFGGYSDKSWFSQISFKYSKNAFLFSIDFKKKLKSFRNFERSLFFSLSNGPSFGEDLIIGDKADTKKSCRSFLGRTYETCIGYYESYEAQKSLAGLPNFSLKEYEIYQIKFFN